MPNLAAMEGQPIMGVMILAAGFVLALLPARLIKSGLIFVAGLSAGAAGFILSGSLFTNPSIAIRVAIALLAALAAALIARFAINMLFFIAGGSAGLFVFGATMPLVAGRSYSKIEAAFIFIFGGVIFLVLKKPLFQALISVIGATLAVAGTISTALSVAGISYSELNDRARSMWSFAPYMPVALWFSVFALGLSGGGNGKKKGRKSN